MDEVHERAIEEWRTASPVTMELLNAKLDGLLIAILGNREYMQAVVEAWAAPTRGVFKNND